MVVNSGSHIGSSSYSTSCLSDSSSSELFTNTKQSESSWGMPVLMALPVPSWTAQVQEKNTFLDVVLTSDDDEPQVSQRRCSSAPCSKLRHHSPRTCIDIAKLPEVVKQPGAQEQLETPVPFYVPLSLGSQDHVAGRCKPCLFVSRGLACPKGAECDYCHMPHDPRDKKLSARPCKGKRERYHKLLRKALNQMEQDSNVDVSILESPSADKRIKQGNSILYEKLDVYASMLAPGTSECHVPVPMAEEATGVSGTFLPVAPDPNDPFHGKLARKWPHLKTEQVKAASVATTQQLAEELQDEEARGEITTVMLRYINPCYTEAIVTKILEEIGFSGKFDCVYLPRSRNKASNYGYAFVNFIDPTHVSECFNSVHGRVFGSFHRPCQVQLAHVQGECMAGASWRRRHYV